MIRGFIDINTKTLFNGKSPYVFWFPGEGQSTLLNYTMTVWVVSTEETINVRMDKNSIFHLIDPEKVVDETNFDDLQKVLVTDDELTLTGTLINDVYVYPIYFHARSEAIGQFTHPVVISEDGGDSIEITIGLDVYTANENLYINLANMGVEIPESIQKALWTANVHEEQRDDILLNRKFKELVSQYWDVLAGRGSYESLLNSLSWFEWGDILDLKEVWNRTSLVDGQERLAVKDLAMVLTSEYKDMIFSFRKTTYIAIYCALQDVVVTDDGTVSYDDQKNPELMNRVFDWSIEDLSLKLAALGAFYETFFMPIHLELLHCTITDIVFSNTFKTMISGGLGRTDTVYQAGEVDCSVKEGSSWVITNVNTYYDPAMVFIYDHVNENKSMYNQIDVIGVRTDEFTGKLKSVDQQKSFWGQIYSGTGVVVPFTIKINIGQGDFVQSENIFIGKYKNGEFVSSLHRLSHLGVTADNDGMVEFNFNLLFTDEASWSIKFEFTTGSHVVYSHIVNINTLDISNPDIMIYKVCPNQPDVIYKNDATDYLIRMQPFLPEPLDIEGLPAADDWTPMYYQQFLPTSQMGIKLNNILVIDCSQLTGSVTPETVVSYMEDNYNIFEKKQSMSGGTIIYGEGDIKYIVGVSKEFDFNPESVVNYIKTNFGENCIVRNTNGFFGQNHHLERLGGATKSERDSAVLEDYWVSQDETLVAVPDLSYINNISEFEWEFVNVSKNITYTNTTSHENISGQNISIRSPFVSSFDEQLLEPGYYDVVFKYKVVGSTDVRELKKKSCFRVVTV